MNKRNIVFTLVVVLFLALPGVAVSSHPPDPTDWDADFGTALGFGDDESASIPLLTPVLFYGVAYDTLHINSNGNVTFDTPETAYDGLAGLFSSHLMAAPLLGDWDPGVAGDVFWKQLADGTLVVTWFEVPEFNPEDGGDSNTFQMAIYPNGTVRFSYQHLETDGLDCVVDEGTCIGEEDMIVGVSSGTLLVATGSDIRALSGSSLYLCWGGTEYFLAGSLACGGPAFAYAPVRVTWNGQGVDMVRVQLTWGGQDVGIPDAITAPNHEGLNGYALFWVPAGSNYRFRVEYGTPDGGLADGWYGPVTIGPRLIDSDGNRVAIFVIEISESSS